jgi:hypothetical protein
MIDRMNSLYTQGVEKFYWGGARATKRACARSRPIPILPLEFISLYSSNSPSFCNSFRPSSAVFSMCRGLGRPFVSTSASWRFD